MVVIPLLGFTYMLTITGPREGTIAYTVFQVDIYIVLYYSIIYYILCYKS